MGIRDSSARITLKTATTHIAKGAAHASRYCMPRDENIQSNAPLAIAIDNAPLRASQKTGVRNRPEKS